MPDTPRSVFTKAEHIRDYLDIGDRVLNALIDMGLPVMRLGNRMFATKRGVDEWLYIMTRAEVDVPLDDRSEMDEAV